MIGMHRLRVLVALLAATVVAAGCAGRKLPVDFERDEASIALAPAEDGPLAEFETGLTRRLDPGSSAFELIDDSREALEWRLALVDSARSSLDLQYYFWLGDASGYLLLDRVLLAADRGVRVRILIDDMKVEGKDDDRVLQLIDVHPNVELVLYNPWRKREGFMARGSNFLGDMRRLNRRMHNKLLVADGRLAILGGRNIGDHYFGLGETFNNIDLDVLAAGPIVAELSSSFDYYVHCGLAFPAREFGFDVTGEELAEKRAEIASILEEHRPLLRRFSVEVRDWSERLTGLVDRMHHGRYWLVYDEPGETPEDRPTQVAEFLDRVFPEVESDVLLASAFFVTDFAGVDWVREKVEAGYRIRVLTNSLASNPNTVSHAGYRKYRRPLLLAGAELFELRPDAAQKPEFETDPVSGDRLALHTKAMVVDNRYVFIGSYNADPRSAEINTEMGVLIDSTGLAGETTAAIESSMTPENSWRVELDGKGKLRWVSSDGELDRQPARGALQRFLSRAGGWFIPERWL